jgi:hypothetical protein
MEGLAVNLVVVSFVRHRGQDMYMGLFLVFFVPMLATVSHNPLSELLPMGIRFVVAAMCAVAFVCEHSCPPLRPESPSEMTRTPETKQHCAGRQPRR